MIKKVLPFIFGFIIIFFVAIPFTFVKAANVTLSIKNQTATSATLSASGMIPGVAYQFKSSPASLIGDEKDQTKQVTASSTGTAEATFSNLILHRSYVFYLFEYNTKTQSVVTPSVANISFEAGSGFGPVKFTIKDQTATSVTVIASGMIPGVAYQFKSSPTSLIGDEKDQTKQVTASSTGTAEATFSGFILHRHYYLTLFEYNTKTQSAITPPIANIDFKAGSGFGLVDFIVKCETATSATLSASGMIPGVVYQFKVTSVSLDNSQDQTKQVTASSTGTAEATFSNLILHRSYVFYLFEYNTKTQSVVTPSVANISFEAGKNTIDNLCKEDNVGVCPNGATNYPVCTISGGSGSRTASNVEFSGLVPVCNTIVNDSGGFDDPCDFNMIMAIVNKVINFLLFILATPLFGLIIVYTGWLYLSAGGSSENVTKAKHIFKNALIGYVIALAAWLIVKTILSTLGFTGPMFLG